MQSAAHTVVYRCHYCCVPMSLLCTGVTIVYRCHYCVPVSLLCTGVTIVYRCHYCVPVSLLCTGVTIVVYRCHYCVPVSLLLCTDVTIVVYRCHYCCVPVSLLLCTDVTIFRCPILCTILLICNVGNSVLNRGIYRYTYMKRCTQRSTVRFKTVIAACKQHLDKLFS